jgi:hypothetical protein
MSIHSTREITLTFTALTFTESAWNELVLPALDSISVAKSKRLPQLMNWGHNPTVDVVYEAVLAAEEDVGDGKPNLWVDFIDQHILV